jgi:hypothetical protein
VFFCEEFENGGSKEVLEDEEVLGLERARVEIFFQKNSLGT